VSRPGDAEEQRAERLASNVPASVSAAHSLAGGSGLPSDAASGSGAALPHGVQEEYGRWLGADLSSVRLHTGPKAHESATALGASAYTNGSHIVVGDSSHPLPTPTLLAHELAHVIHGGPNVIWRQPLPGGQSSGPDVTVPPGTPPNPLLTPVPKVPDYSCPAMTVTVPVPRLGTPQGPDVVEYATIANPIRWQRRDDLYVIPEQSVFATEDEARAHGMGAPFTPSPGPLVTPPPPQGPIAPSALAGRSHVYALDGRLDVVGGHSGYLVTTTFTKYAVGAGSTTLVRTDAGWALVDAGMHQVGGVINEVLADAIVDRIAAQVGGERLVEVMLTHIHLDHTALLPRIYARLGIGTLRVNAFQALVPSPTGTGSQLDDLVRLMINARRDRIRAEVRGQLTGSFTPPEGVTDPAQRQVAFDNEVERITLQRMQAIQATTIELSVPSAGQVTAIPMPLGQIAIPTPADPNPPPVTQGSLTGGTLTLLDPGAEAATSRLRTTGQVTGTGTVDIQSSTYAIRMPNSGLLIVVADQRAADVVRLQNAFQTQLQRLGTTETFRIWDMTHHSQAGFASGTAIVRSRQLAALTQMLSEFIDTRAAAGSSAGDALVVSVHGGAGGAESYIDPSHLWLLQSLGYSVFPVTDANAGLTAAQDVSVLDVTLGGGRRVSGIAGPAWAAGSPRDPLLRKAAAAVAALQQQESSLAVQASAEPDAAVRERRQAEQGSAAAARTAIESARTAYIAAVRAEIGRSHRDPATSGRPDIAPAPGAREPAAAEADALRSLLAGFNAPVVGEVPRFTSAALVVVGREQLAAQDEPTRQLLAARARVLELAAGLRYSDSPARRNQVASALDAYRAHLVRYTANAPAGTREVLDAEITHIEADINRLTGLSPAEYGEARQAAALADEVSRHAANPAVVTFAELADGERAERIIRENGGFALVGNQLFQITARGGGFQVSAVPLLPASVPRAATAAPPPQPTTTAMRALPPPEARPGEAGAAPPRPPIFVPGPIPEALLAHPNIINISGRTIVLEGGTVLPPNPSGPVSGLRPGEFFIRGFNSQWTVSDPATGMPIAVARSGGETWQVNSGGLLTLIVDANGNVQAEGGTSIVARGAAALPSYGRDVPIPEPAARGPSTGTRVVAGGMGLFVVVNEILTPISKALGAQRAEIARLEAVLRFWTQFGANPTWEMRTNLSRETVSRTAQPETAVLYGQPVYRFVTDIDVAALSASLDVMIRDYQDLALWLDAGHMIEAITTTPELAPFMTVEQRAMRPTHKAWVGGEPGQRRGRLVDLTAVVERQENRVLGKLDDEMRARLAAMPASARREVYRLKQGSETRLYRLAKTGWMHGDEPILSASSQLGPNPWVRVLERKHGRARVEAVNADARRSALVSAYQIDKPIDDVLKEVTAGGRPITDRQDSHGDLESFVAGPMPGDSRFGVTRYYRHQQEPRIWSVAIGQLNEFWVDEDNIELVDEATVTASLTKAGGTGK
jgi:hypothetical protein